MRAISTVLVLLLAQALFISGAAAKDEFPGRVKFPNVQVYELADLKRDLDKVVVVDARSSYEFDTLRVKGAVNIPVNSSTFVEKLREIRKETDKPIVFYCNGRTCMKSYHAAAKAHEYNIENTWSYDAGIFEWAKAYPDNAELLGISPVDPKKLIAKKDFKTRMLKPDAFADKVYAENASVLVLDVRDKFQRGTSVGFFPGKERWVSLEDKEKVKKKIQQARDRGQTLLIYDEVGKQVRWLQYTIEAVGHTDYYFMDGGAKKYYETVLSQN
jgi:rhodanese-related sulfurtransferase